jgi:conjugal transfer pilus assembly protein TraF
MRRQLMSDVLKTSLRTKRSNPEVKLRRLLDCFVVLWTPRNDGLRLVLSDASKTSLRAKQSNPGCFSWLLMMTVCATLLLSAPYTYAKPSFYDERYRGWLWYEEKKPLATPVVQEQERKDDITPAQAKAEIEQFAKELEELKFMMLARPTPENVKIYREKERAMWEHALTLHDAWDMAKLLYPEQMDLINNPLNVHAVKVKRELESNKGDELIKEFAKKFDLVLFFNPDCKYCQLLSPVLKSFGEEYGFNIEAISNNGSKHEYFRTEHRPELLEKLGIAAFPTVIAVSHDSKTALELIRGYVSISELKEHTLLAIKYLKAQGKQQVTSILER